MYHFFVKPEQLSGKKVEITGSDVNHIRNVLRMKPQEQLCVNDGMGEYLCRIEALSPDTVRAAIIEHREGSSELPARIVLFQGLPKSDKMETIIQKCVELGVHEIVPVEMKRCVVKLDSRKEEAKIKRWQAVSESAAKQSGRWMVPQVQSLLTYRQALEYASSMDHLLFLYERAEGMQATRQAFSRIKPKESVALLVGPEGGFDDEEAKLALQKGAEALTLGKRILRTETAGMAALAMLGYVLER